MKLYISLMVIGIAIGKEVSDAQILEEEIGVDWWNVLKADATCCPGNTDQDSCTEEAGSSCVWFPKPNNAIAQAANSQCVGESFVKCKRRMGIDACCTPACNPGGPGAPNPPIQSGPNQSPPVCGPAVITPQPTPKPTTPSPTPQPTAPTTATPTQAPTTGCALNVNYAFEGRSCTLSGDPHTTMFNGKKHDFQGQPLTEYQGGPELRNSFYYIAPCAGVSDEDMPVKALITHFHWGTRSVSGADYITLILTEKENGATKQYYAYLSSALIYFVDASNGGISTDYDIANGNGVNLNTLNSGSNQIGRRFSVIYTNLATNYKSYFKVVVDGKYEFAIYMQAQHYSQRNGRYAMHYVSMVVPSELKCFTCGLCGDFTTMSSTVIKGSQGGDVGYKAGWNPAYSPEAFDCFGLSWEKYYADNGRTDQYDTTNLECGVEEPEDPCPAGSTISTETNNKCDAAIAAKESCCNNIGNNFCDGLLTDCKVDVCAAANGDTTFDLDAAIKAIITDPIEAVCADPELNPTPPKETKLCDLTGQSIKASRNNEVCRVDITDNMVISMEIEIGQINGDPEYWESVFHIGNENMQRWPGLWVSPDANKEGAANDGFHISYGTTTHSNPYGPTSAAGPAYNDGDTVVYKSTQTQDRLTIIENGVTIFDSAYDPHPIATNVAVYIGDPWYAAADVTIKNLVIKSLEATTTRQEILLNRSFDINQENKEMDINYNLKIIGFVIVLMMLCGFGLYYRSKQKLSKEYISLNDTDSEEINPFINKGQYSSCTQV